MSSEGYQNWHLCSISQVTEEENLLQLEQEAWASDPNNIDNIIQDASADFPEEKSAAGVDQNIQATAEAIAQRCITDKTREGHLRWARTD